MEEMFWEKEKKEKKWKKQKNEAKNRLGLSEAMKRNALTGIKFTVAKVYQLKQDSAIFYDLGKLWKDNREARRESLLGNDENF